MRAHARMPFASESRGATLPRVVPFAVFVAFLVLQGAIAHSSFRDAADWRWLPIARDLAVAALLVWQWPAYVELNRGKEMVPGTHFDMRALHPLFSSVVAGLGVFAVWITFDYGWMVLGAAGDGFLPLP